MTGVTNNQASTAAAPTWNGDDRLGLCDDISHRVANLRNALLLGLEVPRLQAEILHVLHVPPFDGLPVRLQLHTHDSTFHLVVNVHETSTFASCEITAVRAAL